VISEKKREAYRELLRRHGATDLSHETVEKYIKHSRIRMAVYLPILAAIIAYVIYIWVR